MVNLPRFVIAAPASGQGKTTVSVGIMAALRARGLAVAPFKVGPDFIDPGYHALATGRPGRNLDPWLTSEDLIPQLLHHGAVTPQRADVSVIEGVMGLFDGRLGTDGFASTAHIARLTNSPVVLVADISSASRTLAASLNGLRTFDERVQVAGVVLNKSGSSRHFTEVARSCEQIGLPVLGHLPRDAGVSVPSRHLGLIPAAERDSAQATLAHLAQAVEKHLDLDAMLELAHQAPDLDAPEWRPEQTVPATETVTRSEPRPKVAVAGGRAFTFRYAETEELLRANGLEPVIFDPIADTQLPPDVRGLYVGGGFPEVYAQTLASNTGLLQQLRAAVADGMPTVAECAGMLYLLDALQDRPFAGVIPATAAMSGRLTLGYRTASSPHPTLLTRAGETVRGHEFHRTQTHPGAGSSPAWTLQADDRSWAEGFSMTFGANDALNSEPTLHASYLHTHWVGFPQLATRFADAVRRYQPTTSTQTSGAVSDATKPGVLVAESDSQETDLNDPLVFHGDNETAADVEDFAVNVRAQQPPRWLRDVLADELNTLGVYPSPDHAVETLAGFHEVTREQVLVTNGASEAFTVLARAFADREWVVVHPQFTEPDAALRAAGVTPQHVTLDVRTPLRVDDIPESAQVVMVGNPTNPTGVVHARETLRALRRPGRVIVVDEAFMDVAGERESLITADDMAGVVVIRSATKTWSLAGLRAGYLVGDAEVIARCRTHQPHWSVNALALAALTATTTPAARREAAGWYADVALWREHLVRGLRAVGLDPVESSASFVLVQVGRGVRHAVRERGFALRRAETFPGLDETWVRIAVREPAVTDALLRALREVLDEAVDKPATPHRDDRTEPASAHPTTELTS